MIYLDNAATSFPKPITTTRAVNEAMYRFAGNPGRSGHKMSVASSNVVYKCREKLADFFGCDGAENVVFTQNCTMALNIAIKGALIGKSGHIIISDLEHNSVLRPITKLCENGKFSFDTAQTSLYDDEETVNNIKRLIRDDTIMIVLTHASNLCGKVLPIKRVGELAKERGIIFLVDAAQTAGILPINMMGDNIDFLCLPGHKGLMGPFGTGAIISNGKYNLSTIIEGGNGTASLSGVTPDIMPEKLEAGTLNVTGIAGLSAGVNYVNSKGIDKIYHHEMSLAKYAYDRLAKLSSVIFYTPRPENGKFVATICFNLKNIPSEQVSDVLNSRNIAVRAGFHCTALAHKKLGTEKSGAVRISIGAFNTKEDIDRLIFALSSKKFVM